MAMYTAAAIAAPTKNATRAPSRPALVIASSSASGWTTTTTSDAGEREPRDAPKTDMLPAAFHAHRPTTPEITPTHATVLTTLERVPRLSSELKSPSMTTK